MVGKCEPLIVDVGTFIAVDVIAIDVGTLNAMVGVRFGLKPQDDNNKHMRLNIDFDFIFHPFAIK